VSRLERNVNLTAVFLPPVAIAIAIPLLWGNLVGPTDLIIFAAMYLFTGFGITIGYHRLLTHRSFATHPVIERALALAGAYALQGSPLDWVADHRQHHAHTDVEGDPHSPHAGHGAGIRGTLRGLWHAHVGWLWSDTRRPDSRRYAPELREDRFMRALHKRYLWVVLATFLVPTLLGLAIGGGWHAALTALLWAGFVRVFIAHHLTWSINSVCHFAGRRRFLLEDHSTNVFWLALPTLGEAWHHNHHAFARSAFHGLKPWEAALDPSGWVIRLMRRTGLAWNVVQITPERQAERQSAPAPALAAATASRTATP
jgi:stearoyl-CoA desaturase (delta-9 desaturase)